VQRAERSWIRTDEVLMSPTRMMSTQSKLRATPCAGLITTQIEYTGSIAKVGRQEVGCPIDCRLKTRGGHYQRPSEQYAQPLLESMIYVARRTRIVAPARSTILRRVGLLAALSSAARGPLIFFVVSVLLRRSNRILRFK